MRILQRCLFALIVLASLLGLWHALSLEFNLKFGLENNLFDTRPRTVYQLKPRETITFTLNTDQRDIRIISNASITPNSLLDPTEGLLYKLMVTVFDENNKIIFEHDQHHMGKVHWVEQEGRVNARQNRNFYLDHAYEPAANEDFYLLQSQLARGERLEISFEPIDPRIQAVAVRVFDKMKRTPKEALLTWKRLNYQDRDRLARPHIYTASMLSEQDRQRLLSAFWKPLGPAGISDIDFREDTLYIIENPVDNWTTDPWQPEGWLVQHNLKLSALVPEKTQCRAELTALPDYEKGKAALAPISVTFYNKHGKLIDQYTLPSTANDSTPVKVNTQGYVQRLAHFPCPRGWLTVSSSTPLLINLQADGEQLEPIYETTHGYYSPKMGLRYNFAYSTEQPIPLRLDFRVPADASPPASKSQQAALSAKIIAYDRFGHIIAEKNWPLEPQLADNQSQHERLHLPKTPFAKPVAKTKPYYITLPKNTDHVRVSAPRPYAVYAYTRLNTLPYRMPLDNLYDNPLAESSDTFDFNSLKETQSQVWFSVKPEQWSQLNRNDQTVSTVLQQTPPEPAPQYEQGAYRYVSLTPAAYQRAVNVLIARQGPIPTEQTHQKEMISQYHYSKITDHWPITLPDRRQLKPHVPTLVYFRHQLTPFRFSIQLAEQEIMTGYRAGTQGVIELTPADLASVTQRLNGKKTNALTLNFPETELYANYVIPAEADLVKGAPDVRLKRTFYQSQKGAITFHFHKDTAEYPITLQWIDKTLKRKTYLVTISALHDATEHHTKPPAVLTSSYKYSITHRRMEFRATADTKQSYLLSGSNHKYYGPINAYIPLYEDLSPGMYKITIKNLSDPEDNFLIAAYHLLAGKFDETHGPFFLD